MDIKKSSDFLRKRQFLMVLPLLALPFLTMAFWALGGGTGNNEVRPASAQGFDTRLPEAALKDSAAQDKFAAYEKAKRDSSQSDVGQTFAEAMGLNNRSTDRDASDGVPNSQSVNGQLPADETSKQIQLRLNEINRQISQPAPPISGGPPEPDQRNTKDNIQRLNAMMASVKDRQGRDPEMEQLNEMLSKIQAIQNPSSIRHKPDSASREINSPFKAVSAVVDGGQKVADGGVVRLKLTDTATIKGQLFVKGQELFGSCQIVNQRLLLHIQNIRLDKNIIPVDLTIFSLDGMPGIPAPEAELGSAAAGGADNALQSMTILSGDQTLATQAATGGINAAKSLFSKKVRKIKVHLRDQFPVLLRNNDLKVK